MHLYYSYYISISNILVIEPERHQIIFSRVEFIVSIELRQYVIRKTTRNILYLKYHLRRQSIMHVYSIVITFKNIC